MKEKLIWTAVAVGDLAFMKVIWDCTTWSIQWVVCGGTFIYTFIACVMYVLYDCTKRYVAWRNAEFERKNQLFLKRKRRRETIDYDFFNRDSEDVWYEVDVDEQEIR